MTRRHFAVVSDVRMTMGEDGAFYATQEMGGYRHWRPYLDVAGHVTVMARRTDAGDQLCLMEGPGVTYQGLTDYHGLREFCGALPHLVRQLWDGVPGAELYVVRLPEPLSILTAARCVLRRQPYVAMVVADVRGSAAAGLPRLLGRLLIGALVWMIRVLVRNAAGSIYVTQHILQSSYRPGPGQPTLSRSNVMLTTSVRTGGRLDCPTTRNLIALGSQQSDMKGHDVAIRAMEILVRLDGRYRLTLLGAGRMQAALQALVNDLGLSSSVFFLGHVSHPSDVQQALTDSDLMVVPSRTEGLPRALIEGMATGLPAVGSEVGGIPELLSSRCLVAVGDHVGLAETVQAIFSEPGRWRETSAENCRRAADVYEGTKPDRLVDFFEKVHGQVRRRALN